MLKYTYIGSKVPLEVREILSELIDKFGLDSARNHRFSPMDDPAGLDEFEAIAGGGSGFDFEHEIKDSAGRKWLVGCDYGD